VERSRLIGLFNDEASGRSANEGDNGAIEAPHSERAMAMLATHYVKLAVNYHALIKLASTPGLPAKSAPH
jgi:hypothetical protein